jgi:NAD(P)-dependent dehydrogenase (short-subunit alcohol dehydrogenase family)
MGAGTACALAGAGYDLAITARDQLRLDEVAARAEAAGVTCLALASDLLDRSSIDGFATAALERFGRCDVLCNIGIYKGESLRYVVDETTADELVKHYEADVVAPFLLTTRVLPWMCEHRGTIINMGSSSIFMEPPGTAHQNGWSFAYAAAKAGLDQMAPILNVELRGLLVRTFNVEPGFVAYGTDLAEKIRRYPGMPVSPPEAIGPAIVWLIESPEADRLITKRVNLPGLTHRHGLLPGWGGPGTIYP